MKGSRKKQLVTWQQLEDTKQQMTDDPPAMGCVRQLWSSACTMWCHMPQCQLSVCKSLANQWAMGSAMTSVKVFSVWVCFPECSLLSTLKTGCHHGWHCCEWSQDCIKHCFGVKTLPSSFCGLAQHALASVGLLLLSWVVGGGCMLLMVVAVPLLLSVCVTLKTN